MKRAQPQSPPHIHSLFTFRSASCLFGNGHVLTSEASLSVYPSGLLLYCLHSSGSTPIRPLTSFIYANPTSLLSEVRSTTIFTELLSSHILDEFYRERYSSFGLPPKVPFFGGAGLEGSAHPTAPTFFHPPHDQSNGIVTHYVAQIRPQQDVISITQRHSYFACSHVVSPRPPSFTNPAPSPGHRSGNRPASRRERHA